ncbi:hypothetical protein [Neorhizobium alkalisoli]|uniref:hypothetical protein n=1 Tax=Neorhizobium alkalisoli TaxID=528178 RepID=UPI00131A14E1|nr:hypothetical protein [Neorhizobium alkalisoli]
MVPVVLLVVVGSVTPGSGVTGEVPTVPAGAVAVPDCGLVASVAGTWENAGSANARVIATIVASLVSISRSPRMDRQHNRKQGYLVPPGTL